MILALLLLLLLACPTSPLLVNPPLAPLLAIDHGLKRTGVAFTATSSTITPLNIITIITTDGSSLPKLHPLPVHHFVPPGSCGPVSYKTLSDKVTTLVTPQSPLTPSLLSLVKIYAPTAIIVGLPLHKDGNPSRQSYLVRSYCEKELLPALVRVTGCTMEDVEDQGEDCDGEEAGEEGTTEATVTRITPGTRIVLLDERYTSAFATAVTGDKEGIDSDAAGVILGDYCEDVRGEEVFVDVERGGEGSAVEFFEALQEEYVNEVEEKRRGREVEREDVRNRESRKDMIKRVEREERERKAAK